MRKTLLSLPIRIGPCGRCRMSSQPFLRHNGGSEVESSGSNLPCEVPRPSRSSDHQPVESRALKIWSNSVSSRFAVKAQVMTKFCLSFSCMIWTDYRVASAECDGDTEDPLITRSRRRHGRLAR